MITSRQNEQIRHLKRLGADKKYRNEQGLFVCDGLRCLVEAADTGLVTAVFACENTMLPDTGDAPVTFVPADLLNYASSLTSSQNVLFICRMPARNYEVSAAGQYVILDGIQDPGNVGTIVRCAAAFDFDGVILVNSCADIFNPKTVRATMGGIFKIPVLTGGESDLQKAACDGLIVYGAALESRAENIGADGVMRSGVSVAVGSEGAGLSESVKQLCRKLIFIPMSRGIDSLNAAAAASIIMWGVKRNVDT